MKIIIFLLSIAFMITNVQNERIDFVPKAPTCNIKLVKSFGFGGFSEPTPTKLLMCPFIENSCCTTFDQEEIYSRWVIEREREEVQQRFEFYSNVYVRLLKKGETFHDLLLEIIKQMQVKSFSNCKIIASRLAQFQFKIISEQLQEAIKNMYNYYNDLYNGLYCTICDADSQPFFRVQKEAIQYQKKFCRDIISQSLNVLLYLHINLKKYFNLATRFVTNCDFQGNYTKSDAEDSKIFTISKENYDLLTDCKAYRNEIFWMDYCEPICQKFNLFDLDKFFTPDLKQFAYYNRFFGESIEKLKKQQEKAKKKQEKMKQQEVRGLMDFRILEENQKKQEDEDDDENKKEKSDNYYMELVDSYMEQPIYYEPAKAPFDISKFKSIFADSDIGIDMTVIGKKTDISEKIKQSIEAEKKVIAQKQIEEQNLKQLEEITESVVEKKSDKKIHNSIGANTKLFNTIFGMFFFLLNFFNQFY